MNTENIIEIAKEYLIKSCNTPLERMPNFVEALDLAKMYAEKDNVDLLSGLYLGNWFAEIGDSAYHALDHALKVSIILDAKERDRSTRK